MRLPDTGGIHAMLWNDRMDVAEWQKATRPDGSTGFAEVLVVEDQPCKLSYNTLSAVGGGDVAALSQATKVFLDCDVVVKPGSKITVRHRGRELDFSQSGPPGVFGSHQEIPLAPFEGWA